MKIKINFALVSRSFIALLFVVAGVQKLMHFSDTVDAISKLGIPLSALVAVLVILIEVPVALAFAYGYKTRQAGYILAGFTALTILIVHRDISQPMNILMSLKNLAIIGGIMSAIMCFCGDCVVHTGKHNNA